MTTEMAKYLSFCLLFACVSLSWSNPNSCSGRCGQGYYRGSLCQCDYECLGLNECCTDFESLCTTKESCKGRCGEPFNRGNPCHCDNDCITYGQCCPDYESMCLTEDLKPEKSATNAERISNLSLNIKTKKPAESSNEDMSFDEDREDAGELDVPVDESETTSETEEPTSTISPESPTATLYSEGPPTTLSSEGPPTTLSSEGPPTTLPSEGPPTTLPSEGPPTTLPSEGPPTTLPSEGPPTTLPSEGPPTTLPPEGPPTTLPSEGPPTTLPSEGPPTTLPSEGPPTTLPSEGPPTTLPSEGPPPTLPSGGPPTTLPSEGPPTTLPSEGPLTTLSSSTVSTGDLAKELLTPKDPSHVPQETNFTPSPNQLKPTKKPIRPSTDEKNNLNSRDPDLPAAVKPTRKPIKPIKNFDNNGKTDTDYQADDYDSNLCSGRPVSGLTTLRNGTIVVFRGHYSWTLDKDRNPAPPQLISSVWGIPSPIDTVFTRCNCHGKTYFFKGNNYWRFENGEMDPGFPKSVNQGFGRISHITAAISIPQYRSRRESVIFFKRGGLAQKYTYQVTPQCGKKPKIPVITLRHRYRRETDSALGKVITISRSWRGFPSIVTSAVSVPSRVKEGYKYYVFSQKNYYSMKLERENPVILKPASGPKENTANSFFKCPQSNTV